MQLHFSISQCQIAQSPVTRLNLDRTTSEISRACDGDNEDCKKIFTQHVLEFKGKRTTYYKHQNKENAGKQIRTMNNSMVDSLCRKK